jgi:TPR repeat protein
MPQRKTLSSIVFSVALMASAAHAMTQEEDTMVAYAAQRGSDGAQVLLAVMYLHGDPTHAKNESLAASWFEKAAEQGNAYAQKMLGDLYEQGRGVPRSLKLSADWREKSANRGNTEAQLMLGKMYLNGDGVAQDPDKAEGWLNRAAIAGNSEAQFLLGKLYHARKNASMAGNWLARSAAQGYEDAIRFLHFMEGIGFQAEESLHRGPADLHKLAADGDSEAQYQLAIRYESGAYGEKQDYEQALHWFNLAASGGHVMAMKSLAHIHENGLDGIPPDAKAAEYWRKKAAEHAR